MSTISTALRNFKEPTKDELTHIFFSIPPPEPEGSKPEGKDGQDLEKMDINAVLSLGEAEDSYVRWTGWSAQLELMIVNTIA